MVKQVFKSTSAKGGKSSYVVECKKGDVIFEEDDIGTEMFIIQEGKVAISKSYKGNEQQLAVLGQGDFFGEMSVLEELPRTAKAEAETDCRLLRINGSTFDQMLRKNPEIAVRMMRKLSRRLRDTDERLREILGSEPGPMPMMPISRPETERETGPEKLVHDQSEIEFFLAAGNETAVGRRDPVTGIDPDIDLTPADSQRSISRRHATIFRRGGKYYVREEVGTMNGTFINGERIETGMPMEFKHGDEVRFGLIRTVFHAG